MRRTLTALAGALLLAGCGDEGPTGTGGAPPTTTASRPGPQQMADRALLTAADFPQNWKRGSSGRDGVIPCPAVDAARDASTARASSPEFLLNADNAVRSVVYVLADEQEAKRAYADIVATRTRGCLTKAFDELLFAHMDRRPAHRPIQLAEVTPGRVGDESARYRWSSVVLGADFDVTFTAELAVVRDGRGIALVTMYDAFDKIDASLASRLVATAARRLHEQLGG